MESIFRIVLSFLLITLSASFHSFPSFKLSSSRIRLKSHPHSSAPASVPSSTAAPEKPQGHGHGHGGGGPVDPTSFVQNEMRNYAMKLHTRDQAPKEGQQKAETPFTQWEPALSNYVQFLVDSLSVYEAFEQIAQTHPSLTAFKHTGLERAQAIKEDLHWITTQYDTSLTIPSCGESGIKYANFIQKLAKESVPKFMCHYYNHYFAHTAGGRMIGKKMSDKLLGGTELNFYKWKDGDVKVLLDNTRKNIDVMAKAWTAEEKQACLEETMACFKYGGSLMVYMRAPSSTPH